MEMEFTGERFVPTENGQIRYEHLHRYAICTEFVRDKTVLDMASGEGYGSAVLSKAARSVIGVDIDPECIKFAQEKYRKNLNVEFKVGSCDNIPLLNQSVDVVTSFETIEHHDKHEEMMREIKRVLVPEGLLIISSPDKLTYSDIPNYSNEFHVKELYKSELSYLLNSHFKHVRLYGQRLAVGSFIYALDHTDQSKFEAYTTEKGENISHHVCPLESAIYFVAICSDKPIDTSKHAVDSVYIDQTDDLYDALTSRVSFFFHQARQAQFELQQLKDRIQQEQQIHKTLGSDYTQSNSKDLQGSERALIVESTQTSLCFDRSPTPNFPPIPLPDSDENRPFWSIMIPVYNPESTHFEQMLMSVLAQTGSPKEMQIEVVDDCSTQIDVEALVQRVGQGRINYYRQSSNLGLLSNWNDCLQRARGHWIHLLHQDDIVLPGFYARLQSALQQHTNVGAAFCRHFHIDVEGNRQYVSPIERPTPGILENWLERIATVQRIQFASIVVKRSAYETIGGFYSKAGSAADWEMWKRIAVYYPVWYEPEPLACYRLHPLSESSRLQKTGQNIADTRQAIQISASYLPVEQSTQLTSQAMENYALSALNLAEQMISANDVEAALAQIQEGLKCSQSTAIKTRLISILLQEKLSAKPEVALQTEFIKSLEQYKKNPLDETARAYLLKVREQCVRSILSLSDEQLANSQEDWTEIYQAMITSKIQYELSSELDQEFWKKLLRQSDIEQDCRSAIQNLLVVALYHCPEQLPWNLALETIPHWLINDYLEFMMTPPDIFKQVGDADRYYKFMQQWVNYLHDGIMTNSDSSFWQKIAVQFTSNVNFIPLYFNHENLKDIYIKRAQIMAFALTHQGYELDYEFPERSADRKKIRLGILAAHYTPLSETFASLPLYKHLNRDDFEIVLFSLCETGHRLERYCIGHADSFVVLPKNLATQVQTIREADIDILLVVTNVTAVSNTTALLTLHRLARVQIANVCSCTTTGMEHTDYYISGTLTEPKNAQEQYTETLLLIDGPAHCYDFATEECMSSTVSISRADLGIRQDEIVYVSGANFFKILPELETTWMEILANVSNSKLVLYPFTPNWSTSYPKLAFDQRLQSTLKQYGIASDRVIVLDTAPSYGDVRERLKLADIYLDAFPFAGATSLIDPLMVELPCVVMEGSAFRSRMGTAFLRELQLPELVAANVEEYTALAINLGVNSELRFQKRDQIAQRMQQNPRFMDSRNHSKQVGILLQELFQNHEATVLSKRFRLRTINLVSFPDWHQSEEDLLEGLTNLISSAVTCSNKEQLTLLIYLDDTDEAEADMFISSILMHLFVEQGIEGSEEGPEIVLLRSMSSNQWQVLMSSISGRVELDCNNKRAISELGACSLPIHCFPEFIPI